VRSLDVGIAFELRRDFAASADGPIDALEEYDTQSTIDAVAEALRWLGHRPRSIGSGRRFLETMLSGPPEIVFNIAEGRGTRSREAHVPAVCEMLGVPCTHSDPLTQALTLDKSIAKRVVQSAGVPTPPFRLVESAGDADAAANALRWPLFVKPAFEGSSMGVRVTSRVLDRPALVREVERCLHDYRQPVLVEQFLPGVEVTVGVRGFGDRARVIGAMEVAPVTGAAGDFVYGLESKRNYEQLVRYHVPPRIAAHARDAEAAALAAYRVLGCRDIARVDVRFDEEGRANFIEANPLPGLNPVTGDLLVMTRLVGGRYEDVIAAILEEALGRYRELR
jgi:D-alanine-D-alanine ligase